LSVPGAIRRLLGIALTLVAVSVALFWASATYDARVHATRTSPFAALPPFFNRNPVGVRELSALAVRTVARGGPEGAPAAAELARLGGAALPYVLPALDSLDPESRVRVAVALTPIALRMGVAGPDDLASGDQAVLFWTRFWQDRAIDFRAPAVQHLTTRLSERAIALRREDLMHVDTFALPSLIDAIGEVTSEADVGRVQRLSSVLSHVTGAPALLPADASIAQARRAAEIWRDFWALHGSEYSALNGPRRLAATFAETQYGKWLADVLRGGLGRTRGGETALSLIERDLPTTLLLLLVGLGGGFSLAVAWTRFERRASTLTSRYASVIVGTALAAIPCATFARLLSATDAGYVSAAGLVMLTTAAWVSRHLSRSTLRPARISPISAAFSVSAPLGATYPPFVLSAIVLVELMFHLPGLGAAAARALGNGDVNAWMAASLALALATLLLRQAADLLRPRLTAKRSASGP
jgi:ABC-type dipeptide/oligopeptide/nickel transport system permease component